MPKIQRLILTTFCFLFISFSTFAQEGRIVRETIDAPSLRENLFGDSSKPQITVYLPPSYDAEKNRTYPVVKLNGILDWKREIEGHDISDAQLT